MKRKIAVLTLAVMIGTSFAACQGSSTAQTSQSLSSESKSESVTATPEATKAAEELITIGTKADNFYEVKLVNKTGKDIKGVYVKTTSQAEFADNLIAENVVWENEKKADIFYAEKKAEDDTADANAASTETVVSGSSSQEFALEDGYDIKLIFSDDTEYILHAFPCDDIEEGEVCIDSTENVAYLKYNSISTNEAIETKEAEIATKKNAEAAAVTVTVTEVADANAQQDADAQAEAEARAQAEAQAQADAQAAAEAQAQAEAEARAQAEAAARAQAEAEAAAQAQAEAQAAQQQQTQTNNNANGCGDDFAFN